jgi:hypothetical protein
LLQLLVVGVKVNSGEVPLVENLYNRKRANPPLLMV